ncbi:NAD(P)-binding protein [Lysinibacillus sp. NPDC093712]|uniref:NAD(P)-binding protein n=1 Tax=Lysinibacillus sp. NPDC093712 TaxID=3390579 RepID=UPI003D091B76
MDIIVVGGGIAGIVSALLLADNHHVTLIERADSLGGLLQTRKMDNDLSFDFGTHVPRKTGIEELDQVLFGNIDNSKWNEFEFLEVGNYYKGRLNKDSQFINTQMLEKEEYYKGLVELLNTSIIENESELNANDYLEKTFGKTFKEKIFEPILLKLYGEELNDLNSRAHLLFGYGRLICGNQLMTNHLKESVFYDNKIANTSNAIGASFKKSLYPKTPGINQWIESLEDLLNQKKVRIIKGISIDKAVFDNSGNIIEIELNNGEKLHSDLITWTIPINIFSELIEGPLEKNQTEKKFRAVGLFDFEFDKQFQCNNHYIYCNDEHMKSFRITLYSNLSDSNRNTCTVEVIDNYENLLNLSIDIIVEELKDMGIINIDSKVLFSNKQILKNGFPISFMDFYGNDISLQEKLQDQVNNVLFFGRNSKEFFMEEVLSSLYYKLINSGL